MRTFIAINLPAEVREGIYDDTAPLRAATDAVRWVAARSLHATLKFIGELSDAAVDDVRRALEGVASAYAAVTVATTHLGAFPNFRRPRVVWVGMTGEAELRALARDVDASLAPLGVATEARPFQAHLTLGRVKGELSSANAKMLSDAAVVVLPRRTFSVRTIDLMKSELGRSGSRYSVLAAVPLHARGT